MHGNLYLWCADWYGPYPANDTIDYIKTKKGDDSARVLRGGSWGNHPCGCRAAVRDWRAPDGRYGLLGCRVVLCLD